MSFEFKSLEGWLSVSDTASVLNVSRQAVHKMLNSGIFAYEDVRKIGSGIKPVYVIRELAVSDLSKSRI